MSPRTLQHAKHPTVTKDDEGFCTSTVCGGLVCDQGTPGPLISTSLHASPRRKRL